MASALTIVNAMVDHIFFLVPVPDKFNKLLGLSSLPIVNADEVEALSAAGVSILFGDLLSREKEDTNDLEVRLRVVLNNKEVTKGVLFTLIASDTLKKDGK